jgi:hypothetical protein
MVPAFIVARQTFRFLRITDAASCSNILGKGGRVR